jgi:cytochrome P450
VFDHRRHQPGDDIVSQLLATEGDQLAPTELYPLCLLLLLAGFETTVNLIGNTVLALLDRPDQWQALVEDPALAAAAVEETLRWDPPVQRTVRTPLADLELAGVAVPQGSMVVLYLAGANRDPDAYDDPNRFDLTRTGGAEHLAFSAGIHYCLGAPLARLEATVAVQRLVQRFPQLQRAGRLRRRNGTVIRGPAEFVVAQSPTALAA